MKNISTLLMISAAVLILAWGCGLSDSGTGDATGTSTDGDASSTDTTADGDTSTGTASTDGDTGNTDITDGDTGNTDITDGDTGNTDVTDGDTGNTDVTDGDTETVDGDTDVAGSCNAPLPLACGDRLNHSTLVQGRTDEWFGYNCSQRAEGGPEAIYAFRTDQSCAVEMRLTNLTTDLDIFLLRQCDAMTCDTFSSTPLDIQDIEKISFETTAGQALIVSVDGYDTSAGTYTLEVDCDCDAADGDIDEDAPACGATSGTCDFGLVCCYPCGIPGCEWQCTTPCDEAEPACMDGCYMYP